MFFGGKLKELRLKYAKMGLRKFSIEIGMSGSEYSDIERGFASPPKDDEWLRKIAKTLEVPKYSADEMELFICGKSPFVMQLMNEDILMFQGLMSDGSSADGKKLGEVTEWIRNIAIEHNKKAIKYNGTE